MYQNAGEKGVKHPDPADPPRRRGNKVRGHGTWDNDRPPILGVVGRESGTLALAVCHHSTRAELEPLVLAWSQPGSTVYTDEWAAYHHLPSTNRHHETCCHTPGARVWARDADGDGIREVHCNTSEGIWTGLRNFLRPFRGVSKHWLFSYVAVFQAGYNADSWTETFLQAFARPFIPKKT